MVIVDFGAADADGIPTWRDNDPAVDNKPDGRTVSYDSNGEEVPQYVTEAQFGIDLNGDGDMQIDGGPRGDALGIPIEGADWTITKDRYNQWREATTEGLQACIADPGTTQKLDREGCWDNAWTRMTAKDPRLDEDIADLL